MTKLITLRLLIKLKKWWIRLAIVRSVSFTENEETTLVISQRINYIAVNEINEIKD